MTQRTVTILSDDLDGKEGRDIATVTLGYDGGRSALSARRPRPRRRDRASPVEDGAGHEMNVTKRYDGAAQTSRAAAYRVPRSA